MVNKKIEYTLEELEKPISIKEWEGEDKGIETEGEMTDKLVKLEGVPMYPVYAFGGKEGITAPDLYGGGLGERAEILVLEPVADQIRAVHAGLQEIGLGISVLSGFKTPLLQGTIWRHHMKRMLADQGSSLPNSFKILEISDKADKIGSVIEVDQNSTEYKVYFELYKSKDEYFYQCQGDQGIYELIRALAGIGEIKVPLLYDSATTVHNLGNRLNVRLIKGDGSPKCDGVGFDSSSSLGLQRVNAYEDVDKLERNEVLRRIGEDRDIIKYLFGGGFLTETPRVTLPEGLVEIPDGVEIARKMRRIANQASTNRQILFNAMRKGGFDFYRGEQGHFTGQVNGPLNREGVYNQAAKLGAM